MNGFKSGSLDKEAAFNFAFSSLKQNPNRFAVILKINLTKNENLFEVTEEFTYFPQESEVILNDGLAFKVTSFDFMDNYYEISLI